MKKIIYFIILALIMPLSLGWAQIKKDEKTGELEITGTIIDNKSAQIYHDELERFIPRYPKAQAILPISVESGYSIYAETELYEFDEGSNKKIAEFLRERNNVLRVVVKAKEVGEKLELTSIRNEYIGVMGEKTSE